MTNVSQVMRILAELRAEVAELKQEIQSLKAEKAALQANSVSSPQNSQNTTPTAKKGGILRLKDVLKLVGLSRSSVYARIKEGSFPKQIKLGLRCSGWFESDIFAFLDSLAGGVTCA